MPLPSLRFAAALAVAAAVGATPAISQGQVYKCADSAGRTTYSDTPCTRGSKPIDIPNAATASAADSTVCTQLQDEMNRLAAGEKKGNGPSKRRTALHKQYESRCAGISRAPRDQK